MDELAAASCVIGVGRGIAPHDYVQLDPLRRVLGAELAATRKVTDVGWLPHARQIGITGRSIAPKLYVALGMSGKFNHMVGVRRAGFDPGHQFRPRGAHLRLGRRRHRRRLARGRSDACSHARGRGRAVGAPLAPGQVPSLDLTGRTAVITGAARGIGRACAELFAACGGAVAVCDLRGDELAVVEAAIRERGGQVLAMEADVREDAATSAFVTATAERSAPSTSW